MSILTPILVAAAVTAQAPAPAGEPIVFPSAAAAFESGISACEAVYTGAIRGEKSDPTKPGPFSQRGFYMSATGDEAKVEMLMLGRQAHVYKGSVKDAAGVVYVVFSMAPLACRVGSFDAADSQAAALRQLSRAASGWQSVPTTSPTPTAKMQRFGKRIAGASATLNVSWPAARGGGPNGLAAMATMILDNPATAFR